MKTTELKPLYTSNKSYYRKALVHEVGDRKYLQSYNTVVAYADKDGNLHRLWDGWSVTTAKHIDDFVFQFCYDPIPNKQAWIDMTVEDDDEQMQYKIDRPFTFNQYGYVIR